MGLFGSNNKIFFIVSSISGNGNHKKIIYILGNRNPKKLLIFQKMELLGPSSKNKKNPPWKKKFFYFMKWDFLAPPKKLNKTFL